MYLQEAYQIGQHHPVEFGQHPNDLVKDEKWEEANIEEEKSRKRLMWHEVGGSLCPAVKVGLSGKNLMQFQ